MYTPYGWNSHSKVMKNYKKLLPTMLTTTQTNLIVGLLLRDASIDRNSKGQLQPRVGFGQNIQRKERTFYFYDIMQLFYFSVANINFSLLYNSCTCSSNFFYAGITSRLYKF